jgi:hypothetical protein
MAWAWCHDTKNRIWSVPGFFGLGRKDYIPVPDFFLKIYSHLPPRFL